MLDRDTKPDCFSEQNMAAYERVLDTSWTNMKFILAAIVSQTKALKVSGHSTDGAWTKMTGKLKASPKMGLSSFTQDKLLARRCQKTNLKRRIAQKTYKLS